MMVETETEDSEDRKSNLGAIRGLGFGHGGRSERSAGMTPRFVT